jgi:hypothetical protein
MKEVLSDALRALVFRGDIYAAYAGGPNAFRRGARFLMIITLPSAIAVALGALVDYLFNARSSQLWAAVAELVNQVASAMGATSGPLYNFLSWLLGFASSYPSQTWIWLAPLGLILNLLFTWWLYAFLLQITAGWLGGKTRIAKGGFYPAMALAFAPSLLYVFNIFPNFSFPTALVQLWTLVTASLAIHQVYHFSWVRTAATIFLAYVLNIVFLTLAVVGGVILGVVVYMALF